MKPLSFYKQQAFKFGANACLFSSFYKAAKLGNTDFAAGKFMEIVMAWMLGYFRATSGLYMRVYISEKLDHQFGTDFSIETRDTHRDEIGIDMKFDKDVDTSLSNKWHRIVPTYPTEKGHSDSGRTMTGMGALYSILSEVFYQDTLDTTLSGREDFTTLINDVWAHYSKGW